jgi:Holliday junction DNA helicase RuvB
LIHRPKNLAEYSGQSKAKRLIEIYLKDKEQFPHTIITGKAGQGKSSLAYIIANSINKKFFEFIASSITSDKIIELTNKYPNCVIFLDEVHSMDRKEVEKIYSLMEDFTVSGKSFNKFTLLGATTEVGELLKDRRPFFERFKLCIDLEDYEVEDIETIVSNYDLRLNSGSNWIAKEALNIIAKWCRYNPRTAIKMYDIYKRTGSTEDVANIFDIKYSNGYTKKDEKLIKYLSSNKVSGIQGICSYLDINQDYYLNELEPLLLRDNIIVRTPRGRKLSEIGIELASKI